MKRKTKVLLIVFAALVLSFALFRIICINTKDFNDGLENYNIEVFVPEGRADRYKELAPFSGICWEIYEYKLDGNEVEEIEKELDNGFWSKIDGENKEYFVRNYFYASYLKDRAFGRVWRKDFQLSDEVYVSSYTEYQRPFEYNETSINNNWRVFVYDRGNSVYYGLDVYLGR